MIYGKLFLSFFLIGATSFGGGYGMIALIQDTVLANGWLTQQEFMNFIAVSESTPGPLAINIATFIGSSQGGVPGALLATLGVILPSFLIILIIAALLQNVLKYPVVTAFLKGIRPCIITMIVTTGFTMGCRTLLGLTRLSDGLHPDGKGIRLFGVLLLIHLIAVKMIHKKPTPIFMILVSGFLGAFLFR